MKKLLVVIAATAFWAVGAFAEDVTSGVDALTGTANAVGEVVDAKETLQGTWFDKKYNCNWCFQVNSGSDVFCVLRDASTNDVIYSFSRNNVKNFRTEAKTSAFTLSWESVAKNRLYKFSKAYSMDTDLDIDIYHNVYNERHNTKITYVSGEASVK